VLVAIYPGFDIWGKMDTLDLERHLSMYAEKLRKTTDEGGERREAE